MYIRCTDTGGGYQGYYYYASNTRGCLEVDGERFTEWMILKPKY
jgi:hypothetical protein